MASKLYGERVKVTLLLPDEVDLKIRVFAAEKRQGISDLISDVLEFYIDRRSRLDPQIERFKSEKEPEY